jgi:prolyl-tRNA synthetase
MKGVPLRLEIGPKDIEKQQVVLVNRINRKKTMVPRSEMKETVEKMLDDIQKELFERAVSFRDQNTRSAESFDELVNILTADRGFVKTGWCGSEGCESHVKDETSATIRVILEEKETGLSECVDCRKPAKHTVLFAKSY